MTHSQKLADFVENISENKAFLVSIEPAIFGDAGNQLVISGGGRVVRREMEAHSLDGGHTCTRA